jgi:3-oxoacyl-[acyl-carrier protein] reductase
MKHYVITGASRGIGAALAVRLAAKDVTLYLVGRDDDALRQIEDLVKANGAEAKIIAADLASSDGVDNMLERLGDTTVDALVNNAGIAIVKPVTELSVDDWNRTLAINVTTPFLLCRSLLPQMVRGSSIVNILSVAAAAGFPNWSSYCMSKFALDGFSRALREEVRESGIRVITISPAATGTDLWEDIPGDWPKDRMLQPSEVANTIAFALDQPPDVVVDSLVFGKIGGAL